MQELAIDHNRHLSKDDIQIAISIQKDSQHH